MLNILGMGYSNPDGIIDNKFLEELNTGTTAQWIIDKIGILTRRTTLPLEYISETRNVDPRIAPQFASMSPTDLGVAASHMACERAGIKAKEIGLVIVNCSTPGRCVPAEAAAIAQRLEISAPCYDVFTACPAFALHMDYLSRFKAERLPDYILCISTAVLTQNVNYNDRTDGAIWGDGAAAWIVSPRFPGKVSMLQSSFNSDPTRCHAVVVDTFGHFHQDGRAVRDFSVRQTVRLIRQLELTCEIDWKRDVFIGHQANATMLEQVRNNRDIPHENHWYNVTTIGNQAGAGAPATLAMHWDDIQPGQKIIIAVVGAGLSWGSLLLEGQ